MQNQASLKDKIVTKRNSKIGLYIPRAKTEEPDTTEFK